MTAVQSDGENEQLKLLLLRQTFNGNADAYEAWRPGYPDQLFADITFISGIPDGGEIIEVGCGTGQATASLLGRGYKVTAVELGANLAEFAKRKLAQFSEFEVITSAFECAPLIESKYDLLVSATAFHWVDPKLGYEKAWSCLRPEGVIALFWNEHVEGSPPEPFFEAVQELYEQVVPEQSVRYKGLLRPDKLLELKDYAQEIRASGLFGPVTTRTYQWDVTYDTSSYIGLLRTFSDMIALEEDKREDLLDKIANLIDTKLAGKIVKTYLTVLHLAKRLNKDGQIDNGADSGN